MSRKKRLMSGKIVNNFFRPLKTFHPDSLAFSIFQSSDISFCMLAQLTLSQNH